MGIIADGDDVDAAFLGLVFVEGSSAVTIGFVSRSIAIIGDAAAVSPESVGTDECEGIRENR